MIVFVYVHDSEMTSEREGCEQAIVLHQSPLKCDFKSRPFEECPRDDRYYRCFFNMNVVVCYERSVALPIIWSANIVFF